MRDLSGPSRRLTFEDAIEIWLLIFQGWIVSRIAARFDVNQGRISEIRTGKHHPGSREAAVERLTKDDPDLHAAILASHVLEREPKPGTNYRFPF